jgi:hypothetical protein
MSDPNTLLPQMATSSGECDPSRYAFQAHSYYTLGGLPLEKCLLGSVTYHNRYIRLRLAHKVEEWLFCAEQNVLLNDSLYVGAFHQGRHYTFQRLSDSNLSAEVEAALFQRWLFSGVLPLFYPDSLSVKGPEGLRAHALKVCRVVPNEQAVSHFLRENGDLLPTEVK